MNKSRHQGQGVLACAPAPCRLRAGPRDEASAEEGPGSPAEGRSRNLSPPRAKHPCLHLPRSRIHCVCTCPALGPIVSAPALLSDPQLLGQMSGLAAHKRGHSSSTCHVPGSMPASPTLHLPTPAERPREGLTMLSAESWVLSRLHWAPGGFCPGALVSASPTSRSAFPPGAGVAGK